MIPAFSPVPDVQLGVNFHHSPILPPFTPRSTLRATANRGFSPKKQSRANDRFPPLRNPNAWKDELDNGYPATAPVTTYPTTTNQSKCFQSTTILRSVPIMRRHLDSFGGRTYSLPARTKAVPFHTGRFIFDPANPPTFLEELTQNQRLQAEVAMIDKVRKLKKKREALGQRWDWRMFRLSGIEMARGERYNFQAEVQKLKELILPSRARDIYTGRGIRLPQTHHTVRPTRRPSPVNPEQPSAWATLPDPPPSANFARYPQIGSRTGVPGTAEGASSLRQAPPDLVVQSVPAPGIIAPSTTPAAAADTETVKDDGIALNEDETPAPQPTPVMKEHEPVEQIEVVEPDEQFPNDTDPIKNDIATPIIAETPIDRSRSMAAPSASPDGRAQSNPLISVSALSDSVATEEECERLREKFNKLDEDGKGHISFEQLMTVSPSALTENQRRFIRCFYDLVNVNQPFGAEDFIALTVLSEKIVQLSSSVREMFEQINFANLDESIAQYTAMRELCEQWRVKEFGARCGFLLLSKFITPLHFAFSKNKELFGSVDRNARGRIGVGAMLQLLGTTLQRQLEPDTRLTKQIMETIGKETSDDITRLEFLSFIPYFLYLEEMT